MIKKFISPNYNSIFDTENGFFARWGESYEDNPEFCPQGPEILDIEISTICSNGCSFCYKANTENGRYMTINTYLKILDLLPETVVQIAFGIGDITGNPYLYDILQATKDRGIIPNITVNGRRMGCDDYEYLSRLCGAVATSHYDDESCFNTISKLTVKQKNIHKLLAEETFDSCFDLMNKTKTDKRLKDLNAIVFLWLKPKGVRNHYHQLSSFNKYKQLIGYAFDNEVRIGFDSCSAPFFLKAISDYKNFDEISMLVEPCESSLFSYYINVDGVGFPCSFSEGLKEFKGVNILKAKNWNDIWYSEETCRFRNNLLSMCRNCPIYNLGCDEN